MKSHYKTFITAGCLVGSLALAQGNPTPPPARQGETPAQPRADCPCGQMMGGGMMGGGMMGGGMGGGGMMGRAGGQQAMGCPMRGMAEVEVEQTPTGAVLRLTAKEPNQAAQVQRMAQMMERCLEGGEQAQPTEQAPTQQR